jgi:bacteriorhodopsin
MKLRKPDWYWVGMAALVQLLVTVGVLFFYDCAKKPHNTPRSEMRSR